jgi:hypothetical protein
VATSASEPAKLIASLFIQAISRKDTFHLVKNKSKKLFHVDIRWKLIADFHQRNSTQKRDALSK